MPEKSQAEQSGTFDIKEYSDLLRSARDGVDALSGQDRERLLKFGHYYLEVEKNGYQAVNTFEALQSFEGLRKTADYLLRERPDSYDLPRALALLEDHEGMRNLLNSNIGLPVTTYERTFWPLDAPLVKYTKEFLEHNKTPVATGKENVGIDLIAIRNLALQFDIAVPIARAGLKQGAMASLWGMPTRIMDIAAHNRKVARGKWVNPVIPEDFAGKRVLLFDNDAVTGASVHKAVRMLSRFRPASLGIYFSHNVIPEGSASATGTAIQGLPKGLKIFYPDNAPRQQAGDAYIEAHEKLGTLYGRRRISERRFSEEAQRLEKQYPELSKAFKLLAFEHFRVFDSLNPNLPGITEVREQMLRRLNLLFEQHAELLKNNFHGSPEVLENSIRTILGTQPLPFDFELGLIAARYKKQADEAAQSRNVENPHYPSFPIAAFSAARMAVKKGYDVALIVGPEGFAYEPYFKDLGIPTVAVNIPQSGEFESRTVKLIDNLSVLKGKKVLVVEDDVRTGATLQRLLENLRPHTPAKLGLYLGQPKTFQRISNIPTDFKETHIAEVGFDNRIAGKVFIEHLQSKGLELFKKGLP